MQSAFPVVALRARLKRTPHNIASGCYAVTLRVSRRSLRAIKRTLFDASSRRPSVVENRVRPRRLRVHDSAERFAYDGRVPRDDRHRAEPGSPRVDVGNSPHPRSTDIDAPTPSRRVGARNPSTTRIVMNCPSWGTSMDFVDRGDDRPEPISIARCRELLGDEADTLTDQDVELIRRHAETMAQVVVQMYVESRRIPG